MNEDPRCPHCRNCDEKLLERICKPIPQARNWQFRTQSLWLCSVCTKTFTIAENTPSPSI
jgi:hypothetical protein